MSSNAESRLKFLRISGYHGMRPAGRAYIVEVPPGTCEFIEARIHGFLYGFECGGRECFAVPFEIARDAIKLAVRTAKIAPDKEALAHIKEMAKRQAAIPDIDRVPDEYRETMGRPRKYPRPTDDEMAQIAAWWDGPQHMSEVLARVAEMRGQEVPRPTIYGWMGRGRAPHPDRPRGKPKRGRT